MMKTSGHNHEKLGEGFGHQIWWLISSQHVEASHTDLTFEDPHGCFDPTNQSMVPVCGSTLWNLRITYPVLGQIMARPTKKSKNRNTPPTSRSVFLALSQWSNEISHRNGELDAVYKTHPVPSTTLSGLRQKSKTHLPVGFSSEYASVGEYTYTFFDGLPISFWPTKKKN